MKSSTQDKIESNIHKVKGEIKEVAGKLSKNTDLEIEGKSEKIEGKVQEKVGQVKNVFGKQEGGASCAYIPKNDHRSCQERGTCMAKFQKQQKCESQLAIHNQGCTDKAISTLSDS